MIPGRYVNFAAKLAFEGWGHATSFAGALAIPLAYFFAPSYWESWKFRLALFIVVGLLCLLAKTVRQSFDYFDSYYHPIRAVRIVPGEGLYAGKNLIVLEANPYIESQTLMTLYCASTGAQQPIGLLKVLSNSASGSEMTTVELAAIPDINKYFNEKARHEKLYALPLVKDVYFGAIQHV